MYKIIHSQSLAEDLFTDLVIANRATVSIATEYHGDIHLFDRSKIILQSDLYGTVIASDDSTVEYYGTIHSGFMGNGNKSRQPMCLSAHICTEDSAAAFRALEVHGKLIRGELDPSPLPPSKTE